MDRKIALHLGAHKTGSSAIQAALRSCAGMLGAHRVAVMPRSEVARTLVYAQLPEMREIIEGANPGTLIITHEVLLGWPFGPVGDLIPAHPYLYPEAKKRLNFLSRMLADRDVRVIYYIRDQSTFLESFYIQSVQMGANFSFDEWLSRIDFSRLSWLPIIEEMRNRFPVCVKRYETEFAHTQSEAFARFLAVVAPSIPHQELSQITFEEPTNRSLNVTGLSLMAEINKIEMDPKLRNTLRQLLQKHLSNIDGERPSLLSEQQKEILAVYRAENEALAQ